jgi:hypothetical protein
MRAVLLTVCQVHLRGLFQDHIMVRYSMRLAGEPCLVARQGRVIYFCCVEFVEHCLQKGKPASGVLDGPQAHRFEIPNDVRIVENPGHCGKLLPFRGGVVVWMAGYLSDLARQRGRLVHSLTLARQ